ncbi:MAG: hypothetical protein KAS38_20460, partial [Anaerolineales bacterium]|nr:hypothetical protein [Anaerolineales bacterium]
GPLSVGFVDSINQVKTMYHQDSTDNIRQEILSNLNVRYIFWGPAERALGGWDPHEASYLFEVYETDGYSIFELTSEDYLIE